MKPDQKFTPKYWVFHNTQDTEVFLETADKSLGGSGELAAKHHPNAFDKYEFYGMTPVIRFHWLRLGSQNK